MFGLTVGEIGIVLFILALVWGASLLPRAAERIAVAMAAREGRAPRVHRKVK